MAMDSWEPAKVAEAVTPSDSAPLNRTSRALYVGVAGNVVAVIGGQAVTFANVPVGTVLPVVCSRVNSTGTTASSIVSLS